MDEVVFTVPGQPVAKGRPRFGKGRVYTPEKTSNYEKLIRQVSWINFRKPFDGPIRVEIIATFEVPKSLSKKRAAERMHRHHTQKPDADNVQKAILDGMAGIAFHDDSQVAEKEIKKFWGLEGKVLVRVRRLGGGA